MEILLKDVLQDQFMDVIGQNSYNKIHPTSFSSFVFDALMSTKRSMTWSCIPNYNFSYPLINLSNKVSQ